MAGVCRSLRERRGAQHTTSHPWRRQRGCVPVWSSIPQTNRVLAHPSSKGV